MSRNNRLDTFIIFFSNLPHDIDLELKTDLKYFDNFFTHKKI